MYVFMRRLRRLMKEEEKKLFEMKKRAGDDDELRQAMSERASKRAREREL